MNADSLLEPRIYTSHEHGLSSPTSMHDNRKIGRLNDEGTIRPLAAAAVNSVLVFRSMCAMAWPQQIVFAHRVDPAAKSLRRPAVVQLLQPSHGVIS